MLERAVATGRAPTLQLLMERGHYVDECVAAFPSVTPVCAASIATGTGPDEHEIPAMNWWHRGEERYVEYGTSFGASRALRHPPVAHRHDLQHEPRAPLARRRDGVRDARRRRHPHRRHDLPDVPRPPPPRAVGRHRADAARATPLFGLPTLGPEGALLRRHVRRRARRRCRSQLGLPGRARPALGLRRRVPGRARPVRLPAAVAARQRHALAQVRPVRPGRLDRRRRPADRAR